MGSLVNTNCGCAVQTGNGWQGETVTFVDSLQQKLGLLDPAIGDAFDSVVVLAKAGGGSTDIDGGTASSNSSTTIDGGNA